MLTHAGCGQVERQRYLLNLDPATWEKMAEEGYFQKAEDDLTAAAKEEKAVRGVTDRSSSKASSKVSKVTSPRRHAQVAKANCLCSN